MSVQTRLGPTAVALLMPVCLSALPYYNAIRINPIPGDSIGFAVGVNNNGQAAGWSLDSGLGTNQALSYLSGTTTGLGFLSGHARSQANGLNDSGVIVGTSWPNGGASRAFSYFSGTMTDLGTLPGGLNSEAFAINATGQITGHGINAGGRNEAFSYSGGAMTGLGSLAANGFSYGRGINASGEIVGYSVTPFGVSQAFRYTSGTMTGLGFLPGGANSFAFGINESGQIVGRSESSKTPFDEAFLFSGGTMTGLGFLPGDNSSAASAINKQGLVVGNSASMSGVRAFGWESGLLYDLNTRLLNGAGWQLISAISISDTGYIVGYGSFQGSQTAYILVPVANTPEPATFLMAGLGIAALRLWRRFHR